MVVEIVPRQTLPVDVQAVQFVGGSRNGKDIVDWVREFGGFASWQGSYEFTANPDGSGQNGWAEVLVVGQAGRTTKAVNVNDWVVMDADGKIDVVPPGKFDQQYGVPEETPPPA